MYIFIFGFLFGIIVHNSFLSLYENFLTKYLNYTIIMYNWYYTTFIIVHFLNIVVMVLDLDAYLQDLLLNSCTRKNVMGN